MGHYGAVSRKLHSEERTPEDSSQGYNRRRVTETDEAISLNRESTAIDIDIAAVDTEEANGICNGNGSRIEENIARLRDYDGGQHSGQTWSLVLIPFLFLGFIGFLVTFLVLYISSSGI